MENNVQQNMLLPPRPGTFKDREELISYVRDFGATQGYVVTIQKSKKDRNVVLGCDRGGYYRNRRKSDELKRKRKESSRLINCPFEAVGRKDDDDDVWVLTVKNGEHNHEPLKDMSEHRYNRRFSEEEVRIIKDMTEAGAKPLEVLKALKQSIPQLQSTPRHLYNVKAKLRQGNISEKCFKSWRPNPSALAERNFAEISSDRIHQLKVSNFIGGKFVESQGGVFVDVINPATQEVVSRVPSTTYEEFKAAIVSAEQAFPSWKKTPISARQRIIYKLQVLIRRDINELAVNISTEQGRTMKGAHADILSGLEVVERACGRTALQTGEFAPNAAKGIDMYSITEPLGVCAGICLFDFPATVPLWMFPIAVLCGNTFVLKPSEKDPGITMKIAALAAEAGLPDGVLNIVHGSDDIINHVCEDDDIKAVSFVGSYSVGLHIYAKAAARGKRVQANSGFKNHVIIMPDACVDATLDAIIAVGFGAAGELCMTLSSVIFVGHSAPWEEELKKRAKSLKVNGGTDADADVGPVISKEVKDRICNLVQIAVENGARLILDGRDFMVPEYHHGNFIGPTILSGVTTSMDCYKEEISGPVLLCTQVSSLTEATNIVNQHKFGNRASIFTASGMAARRFQNEVEAGLVGINVTVPVPLPFSSTGLMASSAGELNFCGKAGIQFYTQVKMVAQLWKDLPARGSSAAERLASAQPVSRTMRSSSVTDLSSRETSPSVPAVSDREMTDPGISQDMRSNDSGSSDEETPTSLTTTSDLNVSNQAPPSSSKCNEDIFRTQERNGVPLIPHTQKIRAMMPDIPGSPTACFGISPDRHRTNSSEFLSRENADALLPDGCILVRSEGTDAATCFTVEQDYGHNTVGESSRRIDFTGDLSSESPYMSTSHGLDGTATHINAQSTEISTMSPGNNYILPSIMQRTSGRVGNHSPLRRDYTVEPANSEMFLPADSSQRVITDITLTSERVYRNHLQRSGDVQPATERLNVPLSSETAAFSDRSASFPCPSSQGA